MRAHGWNGLPIGTWNTGRDRRAAVRALTGVLGESPRLTEEGGRAGTKPAPAQLAVGVTGTRWA